MPFGLCTARSKSRALPCQALVCFEGDASATRAAAIPATPDGIPRPSRRCREPRRSEESSAAVPRPAPFGSCYRESRSKRRERTHARSFCNSPGAIRIARLFTPEDALSGVPMAVLGDNVGACESLQGRATGPIGRVRSTDVSALRRSRATHRRGCERTGRVGGAQPRLDATWNLSVRGRRTASRFEKEGR